MKRGKSTSEEGIETVSSLVILWTPVLDQGWLEEATGFICLLMLFLNLSGSDGRAGSLQAWSD